MAYIFSKSYFLWFFEAFVQKVLFYFFNIANPAFFELLSYTGYKFVVLCPILATDMIFGYIASYVVLGLLGACYALFFFKTLKRFSSANTLADHIKEVSLNRKTFMLGNCAA